MNVAVLVPRRADHGPRDQVWKWIQHRWETEHPDWPVHEGHHDEGLFNRSAAINQAARDAGDFDIAVIADSDSFVPADQLRAAVDLCASNNYLTLAYDVWCALREDATEQVLAGYDGDLWPGVVVTCEGTCSSMVVVTRPVWDEAEGFDEGFSGWGGEDVGFMHKAQTFGGGCQRVPGPVWHLWHPPAVHRDPTEWAPRCELYSEATYNPEAMHALMDRLRVA